MEASVQLPKIDDTCDILSINGRHCVCRSYYHPDEFDIKVIEYAHSLAQDGQDLYALDLLKFVKYLDINLIHYYTDNSELSL